MTTDYVQVTTATETRDEAVRLARSAVAARLAAGAQIVGPVGSVFVHLGELGEGEEWQVILKTTADKFEELETHLITAHSWEKPEVVAVPFVAVSKPYGEWISATVNAGS
jgi:periplasmic divalent cation tolerance protein